MQLLNDDGAGFSAPITYAEAGIYRDHSKPAEHPQAFYYCPDQPSPAGPGRCPSLAPRRRHHKLEGSMP